jgi:transcriptional regulator with GAF, ATPase, and Fis domain
MQATVFRFPTQCATRCPGTTSTWDLRAAFQLQYKCTGITQSQGDRTTSHDDATPMPDELASLKTRIRELEGFQNFADSLGRLQTVYDILSSIADWCVRITQADHVAVLLFQPITGSPVQTVARSSREVDGNIDHAINALVGGWASTQGKALLVKDIIAELGIAAPSDRQKLYGPAMVIPLAAANEEMIGILNLINDKGHRPFTEDDLRMVSTIAPIATKFIQRDRTHEQLSLDYARLKALHTPAEHQRWVPSLNPRMKDVMDRVALVAATDANVLISGETGTGKELIAWAIHVQSPRSSRPLVAVNCAAIPPNLAESELFGHERGSFTGAESTHKGKFESAHGGTLFLDEVSALPVDLQAKFLRVLEERRFCRVGSSTDIHVDIRLIAATNRDLHDLVHQGLFREDLYHRLNVFPIKIPPLRERPEDIPALAREFLAEFSMGRKHFASDAEELFKTMKWPGNVRELRNLVERVSILCRSSEVTIRDLSAGELREGDSLQTDLRSTFRRLLSEQTEKSHLAEETERALTLAALDAAEGNASKASRLLGITRSALLRKIARYKLRSR